MPNYFIWFAENYWEECEESQGIFENLLLKTWKSQGTFLKTVLRTLFAIHKFVNLAAHNKFYSVLSQNTTICCMFFSCILHPFDQMLQNHTGQWAIAL